MQRNNGPETRVLKPTGCFNMQASIHGGLTNRNTLTQRKFNSAPPFTSTPNTSPHRSAQELVKGDGSSKQDSAVPHEHEEQTASLVGQDLLALQQELELEKRKNQVLRNQVVQRNHSDKYAKPSSLLIPK